MDPNLQCPMCGKPFDEFREGEGFKGEQIHLPYGLQHSSAECLVYLRQRIEKLESDNAQSSGTPDSHTLTS